MTKRAIRLIVLALAVFSFGPSWAQVETKETKEAKEGSDFFQDWAVGLALVKPRKRGISDAAVVNNVVRVNAESKSEATLLVARHFYPWKKRDVKKCSGNDDGRWFSCVGAMVSVGLSTAGSAGASQVINFVGAGLAVGGGVGNDTSTAWHFGLGYGRRFGIKVLGDGFNENEAPPVGETQVRYKSIDLPATFAYFTVHW
jgi:hypothetical protein